MERGKLEARVKMRRSILMLVCEFPISLRSDLFAERKPIVYPFLTGIFYITCDDVMLSCFSRKFSACASLILKRFCIFEKEHIAVTWVMISFSLSISHLMMLCYLTYSIFFALFRSTFSMVFSDVPFQPVAQKNV